MCFHDSPIKVVTLTYDFVYSLTEVFPSMGGTRTDSFSASLSFTLTRVFLKDKGLPIGLDSLGDVAASLNPGEFFLLSNCCCPCKWQFIASFPAAYAGAATQHRSVTFPTLPPISGDVGFEANIIFGITPNVEDYTSLCGKNVAFAPQSVYWPTFDGVTPRDPAFFTTGISLNFHVTSYTGAPALDPGIGSNYSGGSPVSPYFPDLGYFLFYDPATGPPPTPIPGVTGSGTGFRDPCDKAMVFSQSATWTMNDGTLSGTGTGTLAVQFNP